MPGHHFTFFRELKESYSQIGMIFPSSRFLAASMVSALQTKSSKRRILEVGPGTGPITKEILKRMNDTDELYICELNPRFLETLKKRLEKNPLYQKHRQRVHFILGAFQDLQKNQELLGSIDILVCSLPFTNFTPEVVTEIIEVIEKLVAEKGAVTFFEYVGLRKLLSVFSSQENRQRVRAVDALIYQWRNEVEKKGEVHTHLSLFNVPPALAVKLYY